MRYLSLLAVVTVIACLAASSTARVLLAQEGTPTAEEVELAAGVTAREVASGHAAQLPPAPAFFANYRITFAPGAVYVGSAEDPAIGLTAIETGTLTVRLESPSTVNRATGPEEVPAGTEFTMGPGDSHLWPPHVAGEARNETQEPVVALTAYLVPEEGVATPGADTAAEGTELYVVIRRYPLAPGADVAELTRLVRDGFVPIISQVPGFVEYYTYDAGGSDSGTISIFTDAAAAEESTRRAADWVAEANLGAFFAGPPEVIAGPVLLHADAEAVMVGTPAP